MLHSRKGENLKKRLGRKPKTKLLVSLNEGIEETVEVAPGKFEVVKKGDGNLEVVATKIPTGISPLDYLEQTTIRRLERIETLAISGKPDDNIKLKANLALLNKTLPDITKNEQVLTISPYERIKAALEEDEDETGD